MSEWMIAEYSMRRFFSSDAEREVDLAMNREYHEGQQKMLHRHIEHKFNDSVMDVWKELFGPPTTVRQFFRMFALTERKTESHVGSDLKEILRGLD